MSKCSCLFRVQVRQSERRKIARGAACIFLGCLQVDCLWLQLVIFSISCCTQLLFCAYTTLKSPRCQIKPIISESEKGKMILTAAVVASCEHSFGKDIVGRGHQAGKTERKKKKNAFTHTVHPCSFREDVVIPKLIMPVVSRRSALCHRRASTCLEEFSMDHLLQQAGLNSSCQQTGGGRNALPARIICFII